MGNQSAFLLKMIILRNYRHILKKLLNLCGILSQNELEELPPVEPAVALQEKLTVFVGQEAVNNVLPVALEVTVTLPFTLLALTFSLNVL